MNFTVEDDQLVEDNDVLSVFLSTDDPSVDVPNPLANITFIDDDSELCCCIDLSLHELAAESTKNFPAKYIF